MSQFPRHAGGVVAFALVVSGACTSNTVEVQHPTIEDRTVTVSKDVSELCDLMCDSLISDHGVPDARRQDCAFQCASGFDQTPDQCLALVKCIDERRLCTDEAVSEQCEVD